MDKQYEYRSKLVSLEKPKKVSLLKLLFSFKGRIAKGQFLLAFLPLTLLPFVFFDFDNPELFLVIVLIFLWPTFSIQAKRDHDLGKSGWLGILLFLPVVGWLLVVCECGVAIGQFGDNKYGESLYKNEQCIVVRSRLTAQVSYSLM